MKQSRWPLMKNAVTWGDKYEMIKFLLTSDRYTNGPRVREFEDQWAQWVGSKHALMVSSGSTANSLIMAAVKEKYGFKDGDKVLVPACTWVTNISPVFQLGFKPIFCDVNLQNFSFDIEHMKEIKEKHPDIKIVFVTHLLGFPADNNLYQEIFPDAVILDDVCESHGCLDINGYKVGANSVAASFSFYFGHHMTTIEGGMVCTDDEETYQTLRMLRSHGMVRELSNQDYKDSWIEGNPGCNPEFIFAYAAYNMRNNEIGGILGRKQLPNLDENVKLRNFNNERFLRKIDQDKYFTDFKLEGASNYAFNLILKEKDNVHLAKLMTAMRENGIEFRRGSAGGGNQLRQPYLKNLVPPMHFEEFKNTEHIHFYGFYIGNFPSMQVREIDEICEIINKV